MTKFSERLRQLRGNRSQFAMAKLLEISQGAYGYYETGKRQPKLDDFARICKALNVSADWLLGIESARRPDIVRVAELKSDVDRLVSDAARIKKGLDGLLAEGVSLRA